ncbi:hypothetical protein G6F63_016610 [Rhizopus arrhizus]|nr:hypothetical protein G6F63_016610 [Rhizopus arrhizus]
MASGGRPPHRPAWRPASRVRRSVAAAARRCRGRRGRTRYPAPLPVRSGRAVPGAVAGPAPGRRGRRGG